MVLSFVHGDRQRVSVSFYKPHTIEMEENEYHHTAEGTWQLVKEGKKSGVEQNSLNISVKQGLNEPPLLVASNKQASRVIWDANPQLKNIELGRASVYTWKDKQGREWKSRTVQPNQLQTGTALSSGDSDAWFL